MSVAEFVSLCLIAHAPHLILQLYGLHPLAVLLLFLLMLLYPLHCYERPHLSQILVHSLLWLRFLLLLFFLNLCFLQISIVAVTYYALAHCLVSLPHFPALQCPLTFEVCIYLLSPFFTYLLSLWILCVVQ